MLRVRNAQEFFMWVHCNMAQQLTLIGWLSHWLIYAFLCIAHWSAGALRPLWHPPKEDEKSQGNQGLSNSWSWNVRASEQWVQRSFREKRCQFWRVATHFRSKFLRERGVIHLARCATMKLMAIIFLRMWLEPVDNLPILGTCCLHHFIGPCCLCFQQLLVFCSLCTFLSFFCYFYTCFHVFPISYVTIC